MKKIIQFYFFFLTLNTSRKDVANIFFKGQENKLSFWHEPSHLCVPGKDQVLVTLTYNTYLNESPKEGLNW